MKVLSPALLGLTVLALTTAPAAAQINTSIGVGITRPTGDFGEFYDEGYTVRGQLGLSLLLADVHAQAGYTRVPFTEDAGIANADDLGYFHGAVGARLGMGLVWVGANAGYFFGGDLEDNEVAFFPEVGVGLGPAEVVADYVFGDLSALSLRAALKF